MPTKRKRRTRARAGKLSMYSFGISGLLNFIGGWHPPQGEFELRRSHWLTWKEFLSDWVAVREECLTTEDFQHNGSYFAEQVLRAYGPKGPPADATYEDICAA